MKEALADVGLPLLVVTAGMLFAAAVFCGLPAWLYVWTIEAFLAAP